MRVCLVALLASVTLAGQTDRVAFEAASIREVPQETRGSASVQVYPGRLEVLRAPLLSLIVLAFDVGVGNVTGPDWLKPGANTKRFDLRATFPASLDRKHLPAMLQALLVERFGIVSHIESKPIEVYALTVGPGGVKMKEVEAANVLAENIPDDGRRVISDQRTQPFETKSLVEDNETRIVAASEKIRVVTAGSLYESTYNEASSTLTYVATRMTMDELASTLSSRTDKPVIDRTGLSGRYQFTIDLPRTNAAARIIERSAMTNRDGAPISAEAGRTSDTRKAVEKLGLQLERQPGSMKVLVVDSVRQTPTEN